MITFTESERVALIAKLQTYLASELDVELGRFDAEFLLDFVVKEIGPAIYNRGLHDAQAVLAKRIDDVNEAIYALEQHVSG
jgi:uncharacterized protein (DUF2164 family)